MQYNYVMSVYVVTGVRPSGDVVRRLNVSGVQKIQRILRLPRTQNIALTQCPSASINEAKLYHIVTYIVWSQARSDVVHVRMYNHTCASLIHIFRCLNFRSS